MASNDDRPSDEELGFDTLAVRAGYNRTNEGEHGEAIFATSSYVYESAAQAAARFSGDEPGNIYSRFTNPTVNAFERRLAALEGGERCVATASGMGAILTACLGSLKAGDHIVSSRAIFGSTVVLFDNILARFGIATTFVAQTDLDAWRAAIRPETKMLFLETPSNPVTEIADVAALAELAHENDCLLVVDNAFCTPALQRPLALGADIIIHSATKYIDGQGRCIGGAVVGTEERVGGDIYGIVRTGGISMSPFNAWVFLKGLETLRIRMEAHCRNAQLLAEWLEAQPAVTRVNYPGLASHPQHALAAKQQSGFGGVLSFEVRDGQAGAWRLIDSTRLLSITANLGDTKTTITHPATTTHGRVDPAARLEAGVSDGLVRIAVGLEDIDDIKADLQRGLDLL
ncbi:MAG TPA: O-succinylhomoserine sulfhydrylase [Gammaproteobacteria bacterium]|nr:O-succinylhomoserine sulfhydrylase [Gammaproteobacteria bacterium]